MFRSFFIPRPTTVNIKTPCHEKWEEMNNAGINKFCQSCSKKVIDFTSMSDHQILEYLNNSRGNLCGRFYNDQLSRPLIKEKNNKRKSFKKVLTFFVLFFNVFSVKLKAQENKIQTVVIDENGNSTNVVNKTKPQDSLLIKETCHTQELNQIYGRILYSQSKIAADNIVVQIKGTQIKTKSDFFGNFTITIPQYLVNKNTVLLFISSDEEIIQELSILNDRQNEYLKVYLDIYPSSCRTITLGMFVSRPEKVTFESTIQLSSPIFNDFNRNQSSPHDMHPNLKGEADTPRLVE